MSNEVINSILKDIAVEAGDEFQRNFQRKGFFEKRWQATKKHNKIGSLMNRTGRLSGSIHSKIEGNSVVFTSDVPYAAVHNDGGTIRKRGGKGTFKMPQRQFIGSHPKLEQAIVEIATEKIEAYVQTLFKQR